MQNDRRSRGHEIPILSITLRADLGVKRTYINPFTNPEGDRVSQSDRKRWVPISF